jgi:hypothetical protein
LPQGAILNVSGGYVRYTGGTVHTTRLIGADGRLYNVADADPMMSYLGIYGGYTPRRNSLPVISALVARWSIIRAPGLHRWSRAPT